MKEKLKINYSKKNSDRKSNEFSKQHYNSMCDQLLQTKNGISFFRSKTYFVILLCFGFFVSCNQHSEKPEESVFKIFDNEDFSVAYKALDITQTSDGKFLIYGSVDDQKPYFLLADQDGTFLADTIIADGFSNPASKMMENNGKWRVAVMNTSTLGTTFLEVSLPDNKISVERAADLNTAIYPLSVRQTKTGQILILHYNRSENSTAIISLQSDLSIQWNQNYEIEADIEKEIIEIFAGQAPQQPWFIDASNDGSFIYANAFYQFTLNTLLVNAQTGALTGTIDGVNNDVGIREMKSFSNNKIWITRFANKKNFLLPNAEVGPTTSVFSGDLGGNLLREISESETIRFLEVPEMNQVIIAGDTKGNGVGIYIYDLISGELLKTIYVGQFDNFKLGGIALTTKRELIVTGQATLEGLFSRLFLSTVDIKVE